MGSAAGGAGSETTFWMPPHQPSDLVEEQGFPAAADEPTAPGTVQPAPSAGDLEGKQQAAGSDNPTDLGDTQPLPTPGSLAASPAGAPGQPEEHPHDDPDDEENDEDDEDGRSDIYDESRDEVDDEEEDEDDADSRELGDDVAEVVGVEGFRHVVRALQYAEDQGATFDADAPDFGDQVSQAMTQYKQHLADVAAEKQARRDATAQARAAALREEATARHGQGDAMTDTLTTQQAAYDQQSEEYTAAEQAYEAAAQAYRDKQNTLWQAERDLSATQHEQKRHHDDAGWLERRAASLEQRHPKPGTSIGTQTA